MYYTKYSEQVEHEERCSECGGTGTIPMTIEQACYEVAYRTFVKTHDEPIAGSAYIREVLQLLAEGKECRNCCGTGVV